MNRLLECIGEAVSSVAMAGLVIVILGVAIVAATWPFWAALAALKFLFT